MDTNTYVSDMDKRLAYQMQASCVVLGMVHINKIQALVWWIYYCQQHDILLGADDFVFIIIFDVIESKIIHTYQTSTYMVVKDISNFYPDNYDIHEDLFLNILLQTFGLQGEMLRCIVRASVLPSNFRINRSVVCFN